jgi:hypothetical protein
MLQKYLGPFRFLVHYRRHHLMYVILERRHQTYHLYIRCNIHDTMMDYDVDAAVKGSLENLLHQAADDVESNRML